MKIKAYYTIMALFAAVLLASSCKKDNYEPPKSHLTGRVVYQGTPMGVRSNGFVGSGGAQLEIWQHGYAFFTKIPVYVNQDGTYAALLFDGDYLVTRLAGAPWVPQTDSIKVHVSGDTQLDVPVTPYFYVSNAIYTKGATAISASITVQKVNAASTVEAVRLYISRTVLVDQNQNDGVTNVAGAGVTPGTALTASVNIPTTLANTDAVYVRVGVKTTGVAELEYSPAVKVSLK